MLRFGSSRLESVCVRFRDSVTRWFGVTSPLWLRELLRPRGKARNGSACFGPERYRQRRGLDLPPVALLQGAELGYFTAQNQVDRTADALPTTRNSQTGFSSFQNRCLDLDQSGSRSGTGFWTGLLLSATQTWGLSGCSNPKRERAASPSGDGTRGPLARLCGSRPVLRGSAQVSGSDPPFCSAALQGSAAPQVPGGGLGEPPTGERPLGGAVGSRLA